MIQRYDFAPLDGITKVVFRQVYHRMFGGADRYFIPFFSPTDQHILTKRDQRELDPAANAGLPVVPQVMTCRAPDFLWAAEIVADMGYTEVNLNLGCPSGTVVAKGKGAGLLTLAGDTLKTVAACGAAYYATAPLIGQASILYAGLGAVLGHNYPAWARFRGGKGVAVTCVWLVLYLPFWGTLCCIAGGALVLWLGYLPLGAVVIPALAILPAWLSYGPESGILTLALAIIMFSRHYHGLLRIRQGTEPRFFQRRNPK